MSVMEIVSTGSCVVQLNWKWTYIYLFCWWNSWTPAFLPVSFQLFSGYLPSWYNLPTAQGLRWQNFWWYAFQECKTHNTGYLLSWRLSWFWLLGPTLCYYLPSIRRHLCMNPCTTCLPSSLWLMSSCASQSSPRSEPPRPLIFDL